MIVGDLIALCCGIYYGTALMRASKIAKLQAARAPLAPLPIGWAGTDWVCSLQRLPARPRPAPK